MTTPPNDPNYPYSYYPHIPLAPVPLPPQAPKHTNRLIVGLLVAVLIGFGGVIASLQHNKGSTPTASTVAPAAHIPARPAAPAASSIDEAFVTAMRDLAHHLDNYTDAELVGLGHADCAAFKAGLDFVTVISTAVDSGMDAYDAGALAGAAVAAYCPQYKSALPS